MRKKRSRWDVGPEGADVVLRAKRQRCSPCYQSLGEFITWVEECDLCTVYTKLAQVLPILRQLDRMVGMESLKRSVIDQVLFSLQRLCSHRDSMHHTVLYGPPGSGKTSTARILGRLYAALGLLSTTRFSVACRADLIGQYLGSTTQKTQRVLEDSLGGVLFIDEFYSLGNRENRDSYSKECLDCLVAFMSEHARDFILIVAGYKDAIDQNIFAANEGLKRRFPFRYELTQYSASDLRSIFVEQVASAGWHLENDDTLPIELIEENKQYFANSGGDTLNLFNKATLAYAKRAFADYSVMFKVLSRADIEAGLEQHKLHSGKEDDTWESVRHMYT
ncbi:hypothetical protein CVIRNUC_003311 [Coccomyxa viridis]|uniref:AAA+ ATPase domain-containing protein n=1 Tax=Coccomyxa viridis TaxID=1274662 RepID=A0AAV1HYA1_9CHLO|nr:hypothetical protein CVIRNUC_003311 [Coccomyxa viridis]